MSFSDRIFILEITTKDQKISVSLYERSATLISREDIQISLAELLSAAREFVEFFKKSDLSKQETFDYSIELKKLGQRFYSRVFPSTIHSRLQELKDIHLIILLDEQLISIPWELLHDGEEFLCLKFSLGRRVKTQQPTKPSAPKNLRTTLKLLVLADPTGDLPSSGKEARQVSDQLSAAGSVISISTKTKNISKGYVRSNLPDYDMIHYAGHSDYDFDEPSRSGWRLSDGILTVREIREMGKNGVFPRLIFLNACRSVYESSWEIDPKMETQLFGFANAFLLSGVENLIGCLWEVSDDWGASFAAEFYANLAQGFSIGESLRRARVRMFKKTNGRQLVWASYVLYGDPSVCLGDPAKQYRRQVLKRNLSWGVGFILAAGVLIAAKLLPERLQEFQLNNLMKQRDYARVFSLGEEILARNPHSGLVYPFITRSALYIEKSREALKVFERAKGTLGEAKKCEGLRVRLDFEIGKIYFWKEDYRKAAASWMKVFLFDQHQKKESLREDCRILTNAYAMAGDYAKAIDFAREGLDVETLQSRSAGDVTQSLLLIAGLYKEKAFFELWEAAQGNAVSQSKNIALVESGVTGADDLEAAKDFYMKAADYEYAGRFGALGDESLLFKGIALSGLAQINRMQKDIPRAVKHNERALAVLEKIAFPIRSRAAVFFNSSQNKDSALMLEAQCQWIYTAIELADLYVQRGVELDQAFNLLQRAKDTLGSVLVRFDADGPDEWGKDFLALVKKRYAVLLGRVGAQGFRHSDFYQKTEQLIEELK